MCPKCAEEEQIVVFRWRKVRKVEDERGNREWASENGIGAVGMR